MTLEGKETQIEETTATSNEKGTETTQEEKTPTVGITETPEFRMALDKALGKSTASLQQQVTLSKQAAQAMEAEYKSLKATHSKTQEDIQYLEQKLAGLADERFAEDPEVARGFKNTLALELRERKAKAKEESLNLIEAEQEGFRLAYTLGEKSLELKKKYQIPAGLLEVCTSVEQMETLAKAFPEAEEAEIRKEPEKTPKFETNVSSGGKGLPALGAQTDSRELLVRGFSKRK